MNIKTLNLTDENCLATKFLTFLKKCIEFIENSDKVEVLEGLKGDEKLIINITDDLQDGQTVKYRKNETLTQG